MDFVPISLITSTKKEGYVFSRFFSLWQDNSESCQRILMNIFMESWIL